MWSGTQPGVLSQAITLLPLLLRNMSLGAHSENPNRGEVCGERINIDDQTKLNCNTAPVDLCMSLFPDGWIGKSHGIQLGRKKSHLMYIYILTVTFSFKKQIPYGYMEVSVKILIWVQSVNQILVLLA